MSCEHFKQQTLHPTLHYTIKHPLHPNPKTLKPKPSRQTRPSCLKRSGRSASQLGHTRLRVELCCLFYHNHLGTVAGVLFKLVQDPAAFHCWELPRVSAFGLRADEKSSVRRGQLIGHKSHRDRPLQDSTEKDTKTNITGLNTMSRMNV